MFDVNGTLLIFVASFLIFVKLFNEIAIKPVAKAMEERAARIKSELDAARAAREQAQKLLDGYTEHVHAVKAKAQAVINEAAEKASYHRNAKLDDLRKEGQKKLAEAQAAISAERDFLLESLVKQESDLVNDISEKVVGEKVGISLDPAGVRKALEEAVS